MDRANTAIAVIRGELAARSESEIGQHLGRVLADDASFSFVIISRLRGKRLKRIWKVGDGAERGWTLLSRSIAKAMNDPRGPDQFEVNLLFNLMPINSKAPGQQMARSHVGIRGLVLAQAGRPIGAVAPTEMIAQNRPFDLALEKFMERNRIPKAMLQSGELVLFVCDSAQILLCPQEAKPARYLYRGGIYVPPGQIDKADIERFAADMTTWMHNQVNEAGRITYKYWPSQGEESTGDNSVRQVMATVCLGRIALRTNDPEARRIADLNLEHLLAKYYRAENNLGLMWEGVEKAKLGATALAGIACLEHPNRAKYDQPLRQLEAATLYLSNPDGSFRTFYKPENRNDNHNFYPGECLLFWSELRRRRPELYDHDAFMRAFSHYRAHFRRGRNPAFVPWHSQAYVLAWEQEPDQQLADFVFEMNDWLLPMQQWGHKVYPDMRGRFYNPKKPEFGPPHASSTGVYLEGLIDAWWLARQIGDLRRAEAYRVAIMRGLRDLRQLQFRCDEEMFYLQNRKAVFGGLRTEVYNNEIRVDNIQHCLMGVMRILDRLSEDAYTTE